IVFLILTSIISIQNFSQTKTHSKKMALQLFSTAFKEGEFIPAKFSCEGTNISPQLHWSGIPKGVNSFAIIVDDPDAPGGDFVHWIIFNIPGNFIELHENVTPSRNIPDEVMLGTNDFGRIGYGGPCPPEGKPHRYAFKIYALDTILHHLETGATKQQLLDAMKGHILAEAQLTGKYQRAK
ncbi:MAG: YbhB/YbcL family Raf kinase inhibitor-like protein, partial [Ignavibacteriaceae bacterium]|nr:YbhB/YbcL family Raf kinase inhibitor-like protein [Ignavibacteriaceae bacterium]